MDYLKSLLLIVSWPLLIYVVFIISKVVLNRNNQF